MWGAKLHQRRDLIEGLMRALVLAGQNQIDSQDQASLDTIVWPAAKYDVVIIAKYFLLLNCILKCFSILFINIIQFVMVLDVP